MRKYIKIPTVKTMHVICYICAQYIGSLDVLDFHYNTNIRVDESRPDIQFD